jgi:hypothetical protein
MCAEIRFCNIDDEVRQGQGVIFCNDISAARVAGLGSNRDNDALPTALGFFTLSAPRAFRSGAHNVLIIAPDPEVGEQDRHSRCLSSSRLAVPLCKATFAGCAGASHTILPGQSL